MRRLDPLGFYSLRRSCVVAEEPVAAGLDLNVLVLGFTTAAGHSNTACAGGKSSLAVTLPSGTS